MTFFFAELIGTFLLVLLGNGVVANVLLKKTNGSESGWIVISFGWGMAVALSVYATGWLAGAHINPAVTIAFATIGTVPWMLVPYYILGQFVGACLGAVAVWCTYYTHFQETKSMEAKMLCFCTKPAIRNDLWNFVTEVVATAVLLFGILMLLDPHNSISFGLVPYLIGVVVFSIGLSLGGPTGFAINPARDLGPRIMHALLPLGAKKQSDWSYAYIPVVGPIVGGLLGAWIYLWVFSL